MRILTIISLITLLSVPAEAITIDYSFKSASVSRQCEYYEDTSAELTLEDILSKRVIFRPYSKSSFNFSFTRSAHWIRFRYSIPADSDDISLIVKPFYLGFDNTALGNVDVFIPAKDASGKKYKMLRGGWKAAIDRQEYTFLYPVFEITDEYPSGEDIYIRVSTPYTSSFSVMLYSLEGFKRHSNLVFLLLYTCFGVLLSMLLYNLILYIYFIDIAYMFYVLQIFMQLLYQLILAGVFRMIDMDTGNFLMSYIVTMVSIMQIFILLLLKSFCQTAITAPKNNMVINILIVVNFSLTVLSLAGDLFLANILVYVMTGVNSVAMFTASFTALRSGYKPAKFFLIALSAIFIGVIAFSGRALGIFPNNEFTVHSLLIASVFQSILLSLALVHRMISLKKEQDEYKTEIDLAQRIQSDILPKNIPIMDSAVIAYKYMPMKGVGGDFVSIRYWPGSNRLDFIICDVSGHGVPAAMTATSISMALDFAWCGAPEKPDKLLSRLYESVKDKVTDNFFTACICFLDLKKGTLDFVSAGHPPFIKIDRKGGITLHQARGKLIHAYIELEHETATVQLEPGDRIILYTDGLAEAMNPKGELLAESMEKLSNWIKKISDRSHTPEKLCENIYSAMLGYMQKSNLHDDFAVITVDYTGS